MVDVIFMGTPAFSVPSLWSLSGAHRVIAVYTQPDRPAGRKQELQPSPVKQAALVHHIPVFQPEKLRKPEVVAQLADLKPDLIVVAAYGQILPQSVLDIPKYGCINVHASLLPRWRGAAPIQASILAGDSETGVTIMEMEAGLDTGPMLRSEAVDITATETAQTLHDKLSRLGARLLVETLDDYLRGDLKATPQPEEGVTWAHQIEKEHGSIEWNRTAVEIDRQVRAFTPWPGTFTEWDGQTLKILAGSPADGQAAPGEVVKHGNGIAISTQNGLFVPTSVQLAGKKAVSIDEFLRGHPNFIGARLS
ncbi:MAG: methionyl-tRNA formyltransferase [Anaerolineae bacterium]|jgi:methionyl-tRNA formyltransferase|nr:methionyl-tRNA formyltransferase [Anaerolineae bacterium]